MGDDTINTINQTIEIRSGLNTALRFSFVKAIPLPAISDPDMGAADISTDADGDWIEHERMLARRRLERDAALKRAREEVRQRPENKLSVTDPELYHLFRSHGRWEDEG